MQDSIIFSTKPEQDLPATNSVMTSLRDFKYQISTNDDLSIEEDPTTSDERLLQAASHLIVNELNGAPQTFPSYLENKFQNGMNSYNEMTEFLKFLKHHLFHDNNENFVHGYFTLLPNYRSNLSQFVNNAIERNLKSGVELSVTVKEDITFIKGKLFLSMILEDVKLKEGLAELKLPGVIYITSEIESECVRLNRISFSNQLLADLCMQNKVNINGNDSLGAYLNVDSIDCDLGPNYGMVDANGLIDDVDVGLLEKNLEIDTKEQEWNLAPYSRREIQKRDKKDSSLTQVSTTMFVERYSMFSPVLDEGLETIRRSDTLNIGRKFS